MVIVLAFPSDFFCKAIINFLMLILYRKKVFSYCCFVWQEDRLSLATSGGGGATFICRSLNYRGGYLQDHGHDT